MHEILAALFRSIVHMLVAVRPFVYVSTELKIKKNMGCSHVNST